MRVITGRFKVELCVQRNVLSRLECSGVDSEQFRSGNASVQTLHEYGNQDRFW